MSFMKGDLLTRTRKLVKGLAKAEPVWLKAMEQAPPHPDSKHEDAIKICGFDPPPARVFGWRVLELKEQGVNEEEAMTVADMEYRAEKKAKKKAYTRLKQIARLQGKKLPPNPYPSAIKEIQAEEKKYVHDRFFDPKILEIVEKMKQEKALDMQDRMRRGGCITRIYSGKKNSKLYNFFFHPSAEVNPTSCGNGNGKGKDLALFQSMNGMELDPRRNGGRGDADPQGGIRVQSPAMETALTAAITTIKTVNVLATAATQRVTNQTTLAPSWPLTRSNMLDLYGCNSFLNPQRAPNPNPRNKSRALFITQCSTKPNTDRDNATDQNSTFGAHSNSKFQDAKKPTSNPPLFSSNSSFSRGLVFDLGTKSSWDSAEIGSPVVKRYLSDEEERWYMWYHGRPNGNQKDSMGLAVSSNGIHWERGEGAVRSGADVVQRLEQTMLSTGFTILGIVQKRSLPGLAISQDGRHWARIEGEHHTGALLDVGSSGEWDSMFIASPQVVFHGTGDLRMYYHSFDVENGYFAIGIARSRDGIRWLKLGKIIGGGANGGFDEFGVVNACVVRNRKDGKYVMVYEGVAEDGGRSIGVAVSMDGLKNWQRVQDEAILKPSMEDGWDNEGVGSPCLVQMDGDADEWRLYYRGIGKGGRMGIGMAVSEGSEIRRFKRWKGFHL
ncbi:hypothetical protein F0562_032926 [Nyssa sinensis]|uniref:Small ribosomal subunit protein mS23 n=1 Tax=Nyssa sinensis TaxID=561372 RepID=A0A5J5AU53_9ASTE|nr:hypothetical protein F0562_032926 [Nyssa sinensis]